MKNKRTFKVKINGDEKEIAVKLPNAAQKKMANIIYAKNFKMYVENDLFVRDELDKYMLENGLWDDTKQQAVDNLRQLIIMYEDKLTRGGIKKSEGKQFALDLIRARGALSVLLAERNRLDSMTAEGMSENDKFSYLVSVCTVYNDTGKQVFDSLENYEERGEEEVSQVAAGTLMEMLYELDENFQHNLPENKFLRKFGYVDQNLRFINEDGKYVNIDNHLVNDDGQLIDENGNIIVPDEVKVEPFLDDEGNPILEDCVA